MGLPKAIEDFLNEMLNNILQPITDWIRQLSIRKKILCSLVILFIACYCFWGKYINNFLGDLQEYYMVIFSSSIAIPLSNHKQTELNDIIENISFNLIEEEYSKKEKDPEYYNPWTISQIIVSSNRRVDTLISDYISFIKKSDCFVPECDCFSEYKNPGYGNAIVTSWIMLAYHKFKLNIDSNLLAYILNIQNNDGWWSLYPTIKDEDASTSATAFLALALSNTAKTLTNKSLIDRINKSVLKALLWVENQYNNNDKFWEDYPNAGDGRELIAVNGFILHTINQLESDKGKVAIYNSGWLAKFDEYKDELQNKISGKYKIKSSNASGHAITIPGGHLSKDMVNNYDLPWFIVATKDAYPQADIKMKIKLLNFSNEIVDQSRLLYEDCMKGSGAQPWLASEFLISLRQLNNEDVF